MTPARMTQALAEVPSDRQAQRIEAARRRLLEATLDDCGRDTRALAYLSGYLYVAAALASAFFLGQTATALDGPLMFLLPPLLLLGSASESVVRGLRRPETSRAGQALLAHVRREFSAPGPEPGDLRRLFWRRSTVELRLIPLGVLVVIWAHGAAAAQAVLALTTLGAGAVVIRRAIDTFWSIPRRLRTVPVAAPAAPSIRDLRRLAREARREIEALSPSRPDLQSALDNAARQAERWHATRTDLERGIAKAERRGLDGSRLDALRQEHDRVVKTLHTQRHVLVRLHADALLLRSLGRTDSTVETLRTEEELLHSRATALSRALGWLEGRGAESRPSPPTRPLV